MVPAFEYCILLASFIFFIEIPIVLCSPQLILKNDGPAVLGANITFSAAVLDYSTESQLIYIFNDNVEKEIQIPTYSLNVSLSMPFSSDQYVEGGYYMNVKVKVLEFEIYEKTVAENFTYFTLERFLIGKIYLYQGNRSINDDAEKVPIAIQENFTAVIDLYDPNNFLSDAVIAYSWSFDMDNYITFNNSFTYNFSDVGYKHIIAKATATFPDSQSISGFFDKVINAEEPVNNVNHSGNPFLYHGDFLKLNISCDGTPPFAYCFEIVKENTTLDNFTCSQVSMFTSCHMVINKFLPDGKYQLVIYIANDVREVKKIIEIMVYNVSIKPALSTIIIPIICSLLTLIIIATGISYYIQQRKQLAVEVADFDFQDESDLYTSQRTFFEKIFDSFACTNCGQNNLSCINNRSESDPLLNDESLPHV